MPETRTEKRRINLSLNLSVPHQWEAWNILRAIPAGQRTDVVCRMICRASVQDDLLSAIRTVFREELRKVNFAAEIKNIEQPQAGDVDDDVLGFLRSLQEGDDID